MILRVRPKADDLQGLQTPLADPDVQQTRSKSSHRKSAVAIVERIRVVVELPQPGDVQGAFRLPRLYEHGAHGGGRGPRGCTEQQGSKQAAGRQGQTQIRRVTESDAVCTTRTFAARTADAVSSILAA